MVSTATCNDKADNITNNDPQRNHYNSLNNSKETLPAAIEESVHVKPWHNNPKQGILHYNCLYTVPMILVQMVNMKSEPLFSPPSYQKRIHIESHLQFQIFCINQPKSDLESRSQGTLFIICCADNENHTRQIPGGNIMYLKHPRLHSWYRDIDQKEVDRRHRWPHHVLSGSHKLNTSTWKLWPLICISSSSILIQRAEVLHRNCTTISKI